MIKKKIMMVLFIFILVIPSFLSGQRKGQQAQKPSQFSPFKEDTGNKKPLVLRIRNRSRFISVKGDKVYFSPHSGVKRSTYEVYIFDLKEFTEKIGTPQKFKSKKVEVSVVQRRSTNYKSSDPRVSSPAGGIRTIYYDAKIISIVSGKRATRTRGDFSKKTATLRIRNRRDSISVKKDKVYFKPHAGVRRATYRVFIFDLKEFTAKIGNPKNFKPQRVKVKFVKRSSTNYKSSNPNIASPAGGINTIYYDVKILSIVSNY